MCERDSSSASTYESTVDSPQTDSSTRNEPAPYVNFSLLPCKVCGVSSSGYHYGIISCEGCKGFFARSMRRARANNSSSNTQNSYQHRCSPDVPESNNCKQCRFEKCLMSGMNLLSVQVGRHSLQRREQTRMEVSRLAQDNQLLQGKIFRRRAFNRLSTDSTCNSYQDPSSSQSANTPTQNLSLATSSATNSHGNWPPFANPSLVEHILPNIVRPSSLNLQQPIPPALLNLQSLLLMANSSNPFLMAQLALAASANIGNANRTEETIQQQQLLHQFSSVTAEQPSEPPGEKNEEGTVTELLSQFTDIELGFLCALTCFDVNSPTKLPDDFLSIEMIAIHNGSSTGNQNDELNWSVVPLLMQRLFPDSVDKRFANFRTLLAHFRKTARTSGWTVGEFIDRFANLLKDSSKGGSAAKY